MFLAKRGTGLGVNEYFTLTFHFTDILGNDYLQNIVLNILAKENSLEVKTHHAEMPTLVNKCST